MLIYCKADARQHNASSYIIEWSEPNSQLTATFVVDSIQFQYKFYYQSYKNYVRLMIV